MFRRSLHRVPQQWINQQNSNTAANSSSVLSIIALLQASSHQAATSTSKTKSKKKKPVMKKKTTAKAPTVPIVTKTTTKANNNTPSKKKKTIANPTTSSSSSSDAKHEIRSALLLAGDLTDILLKEKNLSGPENVNRRKNLAKQIKYEITCMRSFHELLNACRLNAVTLKALDIHGAARLNQRNIRHQLWVEHLERILLLNNKSEIALSSSSTADRQLLREQSIAKTKQELLQGETKRSGEDLEKFTTSQALFPVTGDILDDILFWWKEAGHLSLTTTSLLELTSNVSPSTSPFVRVIKCLFLLSTPAYGSELGRYEHLSSQRRINSNAAGELSLLKSGRQSRSHRNKTARRVSLEKQEEKAAELEDGHQEEHQQQDDSGASSSSSALSPARYVTMLDTYVEEMFASRQKAKDFLASNEGKEHLSQIAKRYTDLKTDLLTSLQEVRALAWSSSTQNASPEQQEQLRKRILDIVAAGSILARDSHLLRPKDTEQILTAIHHCLGGCIAENRLTCFRERDFLDKANSILPFCFNAIARAREREASWADRSLAIVFNWVHAFATNRCIGINESQAEADRCVRFSLTIAAKQGIPLQVLAKSPLLTSVMSFFGLVSCLSVPILRPLANMLPTETLRDLFYRQQGLLHSATLSSSSSQQHHSQVSQKKHRLIQQQKQALQNQKRDKDGNLINKAMDTAQLVTILPFICLYLPQIAAEVATSLAKKTSSAGTATDNTSKNAVAQFDVSDDGSSSMSSNNNNNNNTATGLAAVPAIVTLVADRFRNLCGGKWLEVNIEIRENVSSILLADLVDPSMTSQSVQLLQQHPDKLPGFFTALFNWGISDLTLSRLRLIFDRVPLAETRVNQERNSTKDFATDLKIMADSCSLFVQSSNTRQGAHAERSAAIIRLLADNLVAEAMESIEEFSDPVDVWTLFTSIYKLFMNSCISSDASQRASATLGVFFKDEIRLKTALGDDINNVLLFLKSGFASTFTDAVSSEDDSSSTSNNSSYRGDAIINNSFFSLPVKQELCTPLLNIIVDRIEQETQLKKNYESEMEIYQQQLENYQQQKAEYENNNNPSSSSSSKKGDRNKKAAVAFSIEEPVKPVSPFGDDKEVQKQQMWSTSTASLFCSLIRGQYIAVSRNIPEELQIPNPGNPDMTVSESLKWLDVLVKCVDAVAAAAATKGSSLAAASLGRNNNKSSSNKSSQKGPDNNSTIDPGDLPPFAIWLRTNSEGYVESLVQQRSSLSDAEFVQLFVSMDRLGLTFNHVLEIMADQTPRLLRGTGLSQQQEEGGVNADEADGSDITSEHQQQQHQQQSSSSPSNVATVVSSTPDAIENRIRFVHAVAYSNIRVLPDQIISATMSIFESLSRDLDNTSFDQMVRLGTVSGRMLECRNNITMSTTDTASSATTKLFSSLIRRVAAKAVYNITGANNNNNSSNIQQATSNDGALSGISNTGSSSTSSSSSSSQIKTPLTPSQAIGLLRALYLTGVPHNSIFAQLLAVVDQARRSAPLLEADVLALCSIVSDMSKKAHEGNLSSSSTIDLDGARAAARDSLAQLLRFLVRSRTLDRVNEFGRLLEAVVTVLATTIEVHTMQELASSAISRARRGQLTNADVETILRILTSRLSVQPHLAQQLARTTLPDIRTFVASQGFHTMTARSCCTSLYLLHQCFPIQNCSLAEINTTIDSFESRMLDTGKQLDIASIAMLTTVYRDMHRSSAILQHVLNHLPTLKPQTCTLRNIRDIASAVVGLKSTHRESMSFMEKRMIVIFKEREQAHINCGGGGGSSSSSFVGNNNTSSSSTTGSETAVLDPTLVSEALAIFAPNRSPNLGDAAAKILTPGYIQNYVTAPQAASTAHSIALLGVRNAAIYHRLMNVVYAERRGSLFSNQQLIANLSFVFDMLNRDIHPELYDLISPRRASAIQARSTLISSALDE